MSPSTSGSDLGEVEPTKPRLVDVTVRGLLDVFDHTIEFPEDWEFVIIYGPNGVGKTRLLELIRAAAGLNQSELLRTPFDLLTLRFNDGSALSFSKLDNDVELPLDPAPEIEGGDQERRPKCTVVLSRPGRPDAQYTISAPWGDQFRRWLDTSTSWYPLDDGHLWRDSTDNEVVSISELYQRYGPHFEAPRATLRQRTRRDSAAAAKVPSEISDFISSLSVHLIETQRLITTGATRTRDPWEDAPPVSYVQTVTQHSDDLRHQLQETITTHSRLSQQLDRTFPRRIIADQDIESSEAAIREIYQSQNELRARLATFSLIDAQSEVALPDQELDEFAIKALATYLNDTERKLTVFTGLLERLELFVEIMNARLVRKSVSIDVNKGITVQRDADGPAIPTESLSSGEQHEMVLLYDLLFRTAPNSIVLIDEPEISLHVVWQQEFLRDIMKVARLSDLRFIVATHSPQIIDEWWARTNELTVG